MCFGTCLSALLILITAALSLPRDGSSVMAQSKSTESPAVTPTYPHTVMSLRSPSDFPELPQDFRKLLTRRGCQIPEYTWVPPGVVKVAQPKTVISGDFAQRGQTDRAVICEKDDQSSIVVFWAKPTGAQCDPELEKADNRDDHESIQAVSSSEIMKTINALNEDPGPDFGAGSWNGNGFPPPEYPNISHSGILANNANKGHSLNYCSQGHWYQFQWVG